MMTSALALCLAGGAMASDADKLAALEEIARRQDERISLLEKKLEERKAEKVASPPNVEVKHQAWQDRSRINLFFEF